MSGTLQVGGITLGTHNSGTGKVDITNAGTADIANATITAGTIGDAVDFPQTGYAQLNLTGPVTSVGDITWNTITGDTTNITQSGRDITLVKAGVYFITFSANAYGSSSSPERQLYIYIRQSSDNANLASARDSTGNFDSSTNYGNAVATVVKSVSANYQIHFGYDSLSGGTGDLYLDTHASIVLIKPA